MDTGTAEENKRRPTKTGKTGIFSGLLYCADCGAKLYFCTCNTYKDDSQNHFVCSNYKSNTGSCKIHYIREQVLYWIVLETIRQTLSYVRMFRKDFKLEMLTQAGKGERKEAGANRPIFHLCGANPHPSLKIGRESLNESEPACQITPAPTKILFTSLWDAA